MSGLKYFSSKEIMCPIGVNITLEAAKSIDFDRLVCYSLYDAMRHMELMMREENTHETFQTKSGLMVRVRSLGASDAPYLVDLFENMSSESRYNRFMQPADNVSIERIWSEAEQIAQLVDSTSFGLIAFADLPDRADAPIGAARYVEVNPLQAEIAVSVRDDLHHQGIGMNLMRLLIDHAGDAGYEQLLGTVQNSNAAMWAMLRKLNYRLERQPEGNYSLITIHIREPKSRAKDWLDVAADFSPEPQIIW